MGNRSRLAWKRIACAGIASAAAVTLGFSVHHDLGITANDFRPKVVANQVALFQQEECLYRAIREKVPKGAPFYVRSPTFLPIQRLAELSTLWAVPQAKLATARWILTLVPAHGHRVTKFAATSTRLDPVHGHCAGITLKVHRV